MTSVLGIPGSLRRGSFNRALLEAIVPIMPASIEYQIFEQLGAVPLYDEDLDHEPFPLAVSALRRAVADADGIVIASPEYNFSIPGPLKNALDWLSRPHGRGALRGKPVLTMVATLGRANGARALSDINRVVAAMGNFALAQPEVIIGPAPSIIRKDEGVRPGLMDPVIIDLVRLALETLAAVIRNGVATETVRRMDAAHRILERARFVPFIRDALDGGASVDGVAERLSNAGISSDLARSWIADVLATAGTTGSG